MKRIFLSAAFAFYGLLFASRALAITYTEVGDAGDLPATAQSITGSTGTPLTQISGALTLTNNTSDSDMFKIYINDPNTFSVSMIYARTANDFDSQLMIFNATGMGIKANDDAASGSPQAVIPAGALTGQLAGNYYLLVSGSGRYATDSGGNLIFPNYNDGTTDSTLTYSPINSTAIVAGFTGFSSEAGSFVLSLAGSQVVPVPEMEGEIIFALCATSAIWWRRLRRGRPVRAGC